VPLAQNPKEIADFAKKPGPAWVRSRILKEMGHVLAADHSGSHYERLHWFFGRLSLDMSVRFR
jgi:hypothetical protein